jgi:hypothetical protein
MVLAQARMFWQVHSYDLKKKRTVVRPSVGMIITTPPKKGTVVWRVHNYFLRKKGSVVWPSVGMVGGVPRARMFQWVHNYNLK